MGDAYRDDLTAAQLRVQGLEREQATLAARNATLEALVPLAEEPAPVPRHEPIGAALLTIGGLIGTGLVLKALHSPPGWWNLVIFVWLVPLFIRLRKEPR